MDIGEESDPITVEPIEDPIPQRTPAPDPEPAVVPDEPVKVPA